MKPIIPHAMIKYITSCFLVCLALVTAAQEKPDTVVTPSGESPISFGVDIMSRYVWRGLNLGGNAPSIQPSLAFSFGTSKHSFQIGAWGAYSIGGSQVAQEADLFVSYSYNELLSLTLTDYFFPADDGSSLKYFDYDKDATGHLFEATVAFNGTSSFPLSVAFSMNMYGADAHKVNADGSTGDIFMSKYLEVGYSHTLKGTDLSYFIGAALDNPDEDLGEVAFYGNQSAGIVNMGITAERSIEITNKFSLPLKTSFVINPEAERVFFVFGLSF